MDEAAKCTVFTDIYACVSLQFAYMSVYLHIWETYSLRKRHNYMTQHTSSYTVCGPQGEGGGPCKAHMHTYILRIYIWAQKYIDVNYTVKPHTDLLHMAAHKYNDNVISVVISAQTDNNDIHGLHESRLADSD